MIKVGFLPASAQSSMRVSICNAIDSVVRTMPLPRHRGQTWVVDSRTDGCNRCRDISSKPKREMRVTWMRALSGLVASRKTVSTSCACLRFAMSIKSMTTKPPISRIRNWRAISAAASKLVASAVSSICLPPVARDELMSIAVKASVGSKTIEPPEGRRISRS